jgi:hypothetical protein
MCLAVKAHGKYSITVDVPVAYLFFFAMGLLSTRQKLKKKAHGKLVFTSSYLS